MCAAVGVDVTAESLVGDVQPTIPWQTVEIEFGVPPGEGLAGSSVVGEDRIEDGDVLRGAVKGNGNYLERLLGDLVLACDDARSARRRRGRSSGPAR